MTYLRIILQHWLAILITSVVTAAAAVGLSFIPTQLYSSEVSLLIVQQQEDYVDPYTSQKAAEKLGANLVSVVGTFDFMNRVIATGQVSADLFSSSTDERRKQWQQMIAAEMIADTGVLQITAYAPTVGEVEDVVLAVAQVLTTNATDYYGGGDSVQIKQIDGPVTSSRTVKPNIPLNGVLAALLGAVAAAIIFIVHAELKRTNQHNNQLGQSLQYQLPTQVNQTEFFPIQPVDYKVLDEFPAQPYVYGAELKDEEAKGMQDEVK